LEKKEKKGLKMLPLLLFRKRERGKNERTPYKEE